ncbi:MAG: hypothetical protein IJT54_04190 [Candidatus Methanomethylophilaceae archaeon]|nr:hypothetical protein [Candidatus Methanomethylophilaceae archaeon]
MIFTLRTSSTEFIPVRAKSVGKAIIKANRMNILGDLLDPDGSLVCIFTVFKDRGDWQDTCIRSWYPLTENDISDINTDSTTRRDFIKGLLLDGRTVSITYGDRDDHDHMAHVSIKESNNIWAFDVSVGCRQFAALSEDRDAAYELSMMGIPQNLRLVREVTQ